ncbi:UTRA domain-containing protein [Oligoflexus tunisiensis]|uniref:UTRA domain-containing protein n=1 Tax=Oligoflexus tunisiensis TaxID=708132 RepID=UPI001C40155F|nr:UTRA domain-containing protein [Oligoflexus tunisiensis]
MHRRPKCFAGAIISSQSLDLLVESEAGERLISCSLPPVPQDDPAALWNGLTASLGDLPLHQVHLALGLDTAKTSQFRRQLIENAPRFCSLEVASDIHMILLGAHGGEPGLVLGLGSKVLAQCFDAERHSHRKGGWGFPFDIGSTGWLGWQALSQTLSLLDGRLSTEFSDAMLHQALLDQCGPSPEKIRDWLLAVQAADYERLGYLVLDHADQNDPAALGLMQKAADEIGQLIRSFDKDQSLPLSLFGSAAERMKPYLPPWLQKWAGPARRTALDGAVLMARQPDLHEICIVPQMSWKVQSTSKLKNSIDALRPDPDATTPLYIQLKNKFAQAIQNGLWSPGHALPSERYLSEALDVSRITIRKTLELLLEEGLIERQQGAGTFVKQRIEQPISVLTGFSDEMKARGIQPETRVLESFIRTATAEEALTLSLKPGQQVAFLKRLRLADGKPVAVEYSVLPRHVLPNPYVMTGSLYAYLKMQKLMPVRALQHLRANIVSSTERDLLQANDDTAVLYITRVGYLADGTPVEFTHSYYRGDSYDFIAELQTDKNVEATPQHRGRAPL